MSDSKTSMIPTTPVTPANTKWRVALIVFGLISLLSFVWLVYSSLKITDYLDDVNRLEVSAVNIVKAVNDATFSRDFETSKNAYAKLSSDIQAYESSLERLQNDVLMSGGAFKELGELWQAKKKY